MKVPFVKLAGRVTRPLRAFAIPVKKAIGLALDSAFEPVTTAASPLTGSLDPVIDAVQEGLGDAGFGQGLSNLGFAEDVRSVTDAASDLFGVIHPPWKTLSS